MPIGKNLFIGMDGLGSLASRCQKDIGRDGIDAEGTWAGRFELLYQFVRKMAPTLVGTD